MWDNGKCGACDYARRRLDPGAGDAGDAEDAGDAGDVGDARDASVHESNGAHWLEQVRRMARNVAQQLRCTLPCVSGAKGPCPFSSARWHDRNQQRGRQHAVGV